MNGKTLAAAGLAVLVLAAASPPLAAIQRETRFTYKEEVVVGPSDVQDNIVSIGGNVTVEGKVRKSILMVGGILTIGGEVGDSVVSFGARVILRSTAVVQSDLVVLGGTLTKETGCRVDGDTVYFKSAEISEKFFKRGLLGFLSLSLLPVILIIKLISLFIWGLVTFLIASLFPRQVAFASDEVRKSLGPVIGTGLLALVVFTILVAFAAVLSVVLIGIPILLALIFAGLVVKFFGRVSMFYFLGQGLARGFGRPRVSALGGSMLGLLLFAFLSFIPILGFLFTTAINVVGWGATIRTKFGTTSNWLRRAPRPVPPATAPIPPAPPSA
jgi:hypothetical protein